MHESKSHCEWTRDVTKPPLNNKITHTRERTQNSKFFLAIPIGISIPIKFAARVFRILPTLVLCMTP